MNAKEIIALTCLLLSTSSRADNGKLIEMADYWFMPSNLVARTCNVTWTGNTIFGEHCFWSGELAARKCFLQGDPSMTRFDIFELAGESINYWGTFRGNGTNDEVSHSFKTPMLWMREKMGVGDQLQSQVFVQVLNPKTRLTEHRAMIDMRMEVNEHYERWTLPETGETYEDVIRISFWSDANRPESKEVYHLARGKGTIRFVSSNRGEPSGVRIAWAVGFEKKSINHPTTPWFSPFGGPPPPAP